MNRYVLYIASSVSMIILPLFALLYGLWDANQPKTGPVGDGVSAPSIQQLIPIFCAMLLGITNLPVAIIRYLKYKKNDIEDKSVGNKQKIH